MLGTLIPQTTHVSRRTSQTFTKNVKYDRTFRQFLSFLLAALQHAEQKYRPSLRYPISSSALAADDVTSISHFDTLDTPN
jgi:hypothetical protein